MKSMDFLKKEREVYQNITMLSSLFLFFSLSPFFGVCVAWQPTLICPKKKKKSHDLGIASGNITLSFFFLIPS